MYPIICHIYGPIYLHSYSVLLELGIFTFIYFVTKQARRVGINQTSCINLILESALVGIIGARLLHIISEIQNYHSLYEAISIWQGGLSVLGGVITVTIYATWYCLYHRIPLLPMLDIGALYAPLIHAIARVGCFLAGCCYGSPTHLPWSVLYTNTHCAAPLGIPLHPTQLYSSVTFIGIFALLQIISRRTLHAGQLIGWYFIGSSMERFCIDFFRNDRIFNSFTKLLTRNLLSFHQLVAIGIGVFGVFLLIMIPMYTAHKKPTSTYVKTH